MPDPQSGTPVSGDTPPREELERQLRETNEALRAAYRAFETANSALINLDKAENWATFDVWGGKGLFTHLMKYDGIDKAQQDFALLDSQLYDLQKELHDIRIYEPIERNRFDTTTKAVDYLFDNIFTDLFVRSAIRRDKEQMSELLTKLNWIITKLECSRMEIENQLKTAR